MNEEFDDSLKNRITNVFDNYEDESAHEGWLLLREQYPEEKKRRGALWLWWGSAAAVFFVILGLGLWFDHTTLPVKNNSIVKLAPDTANLKHGGKIAQNSGGNSQSFNSTAIKPAQPSAQTNGVTQTGTTNNASPQRLSGKINRHKLRSNYLAKAFTNSDIITGKKNTDVLTRQHPATAVQKTNSQITDQQILAATDHKNNAPLTEIQHADSSIVAANLSSAVMAKSDSAIKAKPAVKEIRKDLFALKPTNDVNTKKKADKAVKFGIYAATYINYAKGSDNEFNVGAGFSSEIKLAGNFKLLTGIAVNQNSFSYQTTIPQAANGYLIASLENRDGLQYASAPALAPGIVGFNSSTSAYVLQNYQASLTSLDIPVNIKYQFAKTDAYVSAGVSSGTYITETYQFVYNNAATAGYEPNKKNTTTNNNFNTFDFARTLNLSFGMGYPIGKSNRLIIEPFLKYPLDGLGSQQIKFGAGGVNLKLNFSSPKK